MSSTARSFLFVPATRTERVDTALNSDADAVIVDLEDGVGLADKVSARASLESWTSTRPYLLRVNATGTSLHHDDLRAIASLKYVTGVVLPKAEHADDVRAVIDQLPPNVELYALIESASGLLQAPDIARAGVARLMFGSADYLADLGVVPSPARRWADTRLRRPDRHRNRGTRREGARPRREAVHPSQAARAGEPGVRTHRRRNRMGSASR